MSDQTVDARDASLDTFPKMLLDRARKGGDRVAIREKDYGIWQPTTWAEVLAHVRPFALGLAARGLARGDKVAIIGDNRPPLYWGMAAAQVLGAVPVPMYQDSIAEEMHYILEHAEARFAIVENQEQVDKLLSIREQLPQLELIIFNDPRGLRHYARDGLSSIAEIQADGREKDREAPDLFDQEIAKTSGGDLAVMLYTSGTTGNPKGVMLSYDNMVSTAWNGIRYDNLREGDEVVAYMPMAWIGDHLFSYAQALCIGFTVNCPESSETVLEDLREIGPTYFFAPPRIWESILTSVMVRMEDAARVKRWLFRKFMNLAERVGVRRLDGEPLSFGDRFLYGLGELLVYGPLKNRLGFSRMRVAYTAGEAIGPEIFTFYRSLGVNIKQLYGMTEATALVCSQPDGQVKSDTVGMAMPGVELKIDDNGEVMFRSSGVFDGYFKNPDATAETKTDDGWIRSGDAGLIGSDGHLKIIDRAKDVGRLNDGTMFAPKYIENKLKFSPFIQEAVAHGNGRDYATAFINIDLEAVGNWAERRAIAYTSYADLAAQAPVYDLIRGELQRVNDSLATDEQLRNSQLRRFLILHKELDPDDNELTRTRKVRRRFIAEKYGALIDALYGDAKSVTFEAAVTFEDGRSGTISADIAIGDVDAGAASVTAQAA